MGMTNEEAIEYNKNLREYMRITDKTSEYKFLKENYEALDMAIKALEIVNDFEKAQIITGGRLNGRTYAYKCGLADGQRLERGKKLFNILPLEEQQPILDKIKAEINSPNRGTCDYFIVDRIEEIIDKYKAESDKEVNADADSD